MCLSMATAGAAKEEEKFWWESCNSDDAVAHDLEDLVKVLRADGDLVLDDRCKLSLSASLLRRINVLQQKRRPRRGRRNESYSVDFLCDFMRRTRALKLCGGTSDDEGFVDLRLFSNLRLLELHRLRVSSVKGLEALRSQLVYVRCVRIVGDGGGGLQEMFEECGADKASTGCDWVSLRGAIFRHNRLDRLDASVRFAPHLESLDVSYNRIGMGPALLGLPHLKHLNLANNRISSLKTIGLTVELQVLVLQNNLIDDIEQLSALKGLRELDLRCNCLCDFDSLLPLCKMPALRRLSLIGNPLSCDPDYRSKTCRYLNVRTSSPDVLLQLDDRHLNERELRNIGCCCCFVQQTVDEDDDDSLRSSFDRTPERKESSSALGGQRLQVSPLLVDIDLQIHMQDSGFVADQRPIAASPSQSIGSVGSSLLVDDDEHTQVLRSRTRYSGSDIEILSNPSQSSSIEVLQPSSNLQTHHRNWQ